MATGFYDAQGVWQYGEDDPASPFSDLLNLGMESVSDAIATDRARLGALEESEDSGWLVVTPESALGSGIIRVRRRDNTAFLTVSIEIGTMVSGGTMATIPSSYRPDMDLWIPAFSNSAGGTLVQMHVAATGAFRAFWASGPGPTNLLRTTAAWPLGA